MRGDCERLENDVNDFGKKKRPKKSSLKLMTLRRKLPSHSGHVVSRAARLLRIKWPVCVKCNCNKVGISAECSQ